MGKHTTKRICEIDGCGRVHAAHGLCLMHYKRVKRHGTPEYRWGGRIIGRACAHCERPAIAREMCWRHYQMWHRHGDPLYADKKKAGGMPNGKHWRRGYVMVCPVFESSKATPASAPQVEKGNRPHRCGYKRHNLRDGTKRCRREWEHRKVAKAKPGEVVHHIDLDPTNNDISNLHVFSSPSQHAKAHHSLELIAASLLADGQVIFDRKEGIYRLRQSAIQSTSSRERP